MCETVILSACQWHSESSGGGRGGEEEEELVSCIYSSGVWELADAKALDKSENGGRGE